MADISAETWNEAGVSEIKIHGNNDVNKTLLLLLCIFLTQAKDVAVKIFTTWLIKKSKGNMGLKKISELTKQQIGKYKINRSKLIKGSKDSMCVHEEILIPIIMQSRFPNPKIIKFRSDLGFNQINLILKKEQSVVMPLLKAFSEKK